MTGGQQATRSTHGSRQTLVGLQLPAAAHTTAGAAGATAGAATEMTTALADRSSKKGAEHFTIMLQSW